MPERAVGANGNQEDLHFLEEILIEGGKAAGKPVTTIVV